MRVVQKQKKLTMTVKLSVLFVFVGYQIWLLLFSTPAGKYRCEAAFPPDEACTTSQDDAVMAFMLISLVFYTATWLLTVAAAFADLGTITVIVKRATKVAISGTVVFGAIALILYGAFIGGENFNNVIYTLYWLSLVLCSVAQVELLRNPSA